MSEQRATPSRFGHILAAVDASEWTGPVLEVADEIGRRFDSELHVVHAEQFLPPVYFTEGGLQALRQVLEDQRADAGDWLRQTVEGHLPARPVHTHIVEAPPVAGILETARARQADLIVVGTHGRAGVHHLLLGSVAERVVREAQVPVVTVRREEEGHVAWRRPLQRILCPVNHTDVSVRALEVAIDAATRFEAELTVLHVVEEEDEDAGTQLRWLENLCAGAGTCHIRPQAARGDAATVVLQTATGSATDLIVLGAQQQPLLQSWVLGTTSVRVVRHAPCPVLSVPAVPASTA